MAKPSLFNFIKDLVSNVKKKNQEDPNIETAAPSVFDNITKKVEEVKSQQSASSNDDLMEMLKKKLAEAKNENEVNPNEVTADQSVFKDILGQLDMARKQTTIGHIEVPAEPKVVYEKVITPAPSVQETPAAASSSEPVGSMAMTNSMAGSLGLRTAPDMGSPEISYRIPDSSIVKVLEYSDKSINLDGVNARWVKVAFDGNVGWTLETYLNFN